MAQFLAAWKDGISVWENRDVQARFVQELRAGLGAAQPSPAPTPAPTPTPAKPPYTVKPGDTLSAIAAQEGIGDWHVLYNANEETIENAAHANGHPEGSHGGDLIFAGTVLVIP